jgi:glycosyltransferase involved in cell wall biosynthesis
MGLPRGGTVVFDLTSAARWSGPPVGIARSQRAFAGWLRRTDPAARFVAFDPRIMAYREVKPRFVEAFIDGAATLDTWSLPDPTGARRRRSALLPPALYAVLQLRRTLLRKLERARLGASTPGGAALADGLQRVLMSPRHRAAMLNADGSRRPFPSPDLALGEPAVLGPGDTLLCAGFGWSHSNIEAIAAAKTAAGFRLAVACYDIIPLLFPQFFDPQGVSVIRRYWAAAFATADVVVVNAHAIAADVAAYCERTGVTLGQLSVVPLASMSSDRTALAAGLPAGLSPGRYALFVSTLEPRKGHGLLHRVWLDLLATGVPQAHDFKLVFVGRVGWMTEDLVIALRSDQRLQGSLIHLAQVGDAELAALYRNAAFCLYPSLYEGFGLPLVEAFVHGKTVLSSNAGALAEVAGEFALTLDPHDEAAWLFNLRQWIEAPAARAPFETAIAARFTPRSWDEAAAELFAAIGEAPALTPQAAPPSS